MADLKTVIQAMKKTKIITENKNYLYAEFTSAIMGFVDVEFYLDEGAKVIRSFSLASGTVGSRSKPKNRDHQNKTERTEKPILDSGFLSASVTGIKLRTH